ncbi:MAG: ABC transporter ATP-binding protein [Nitratireductor sp.]|nr:ABC transporter ATP-binding protein [Nitratireductor sp.]
MEPLLKLQDYTIRFATPDGDVHAVTGLDLDLAPGEKLAIVGESGSGKSQCWMGVMGLLARNARVSGRAMFGDRNLLGLTQRQLDAVRGAEICMVFQDPMTALNPVLRISRQLTETLEVHRGAGRREAEKQAIAMLERVGIPDAPRRFRQYPHEMSGGMRQRVVIAMALLTKPRLLIADEPTTALDVTIQAQILDLFQDLVTETGTSLVMISHDLGAVAGIADRVAVMYAGRIVEDSPVDDLYERPAHPYARALLQSIPRVDRATADIRPIDGRPPSLADLPRGCSFAPRCGYRTDACDAAVPPLADIEPGRIAACFHPVHRHTAADSKGSRT